jgi:hypothetical protein
MQGEHRALSLAREAGAERLQLSIVACLRQPARRYLLQATIGEAREIAQCDLRGRMRRLERGDDPGLCPHVYQVWAAGLDGDHRIAAEILASSL